MTLNKFPDQPITVRSVNFWRGDNGRQAIRLLSDLFPEEQFVRWDEIGVADILVSNVFGSPSVLERASAGVKLLYSAASLARFRGLGRQFGDILISSDRRSRKPCRTGGDLQSPSPHLGVHARSAHWR